MNMTFLRSNGAWFSMSRGPKHVTKQRYAAMMKVCGNGEDISSQSSTRESSEANNRNFIIILQPLCSATYNKVQVCPCNPSCSFRWFNGWPTASQTLKFKFSFQAITFKENWMGPRKMNQGVSGSIQLVLVAGLQFCVCCTKFSHCFSYWQYKIQKVLDILNQSVLCTFLS